MAHAGTLGVSEAEAKTRSGLLYGLNDKPVLEMSYLPHFSHEHKLNLCAGLKFGDPPFTSRT
jgi:hypothetical protein